MKRKICNHFLENYENGVVWNFAKKANNKIIIIIVEFRLEIFLNVHLSSLNNEYTLLQRPTDCLVD